MPSDNPAVASLKIEQRAQRKAARYNGSDGELHDALEATFPASDPIAIQAPRPAYGTDSKSLTHVAEMAGERVAELREALIGEVRARPLRALGWAAAAGVVFGFWTAR